LKKQSQFWTWKNTIKVNYDKEIREKYRIGYLAKTKPIKAKLSDKAKGKRNKNSYALMHVCLMLLCSFEKTKPI